MTRRKGNLNEEIACRYYKDQDYSVWMPNWSRFGSTGNFRSSDIFGIFDFVATNGKEIIFGQVKTEKAFRKAVDDQIQNFNLPNHVVREYWVFWDDNSAHVRRYCKNEKKEYKVDLTTMEKI